jgi:hypothetical protein
MLGSKQRDLRIANLDRDSCRSAALSHDGFWRFTCFRTKESRRLQGFIHEQMRRGLHKESRQTMRLVLRTQIQLRVLAFGVRWCGGDVRRHLAT